MIGISKARLSMNIEIRDFLVTYFLITWISNALVVRSMDLIITLVLGVIGALASFNGLKLSTVLIIFVATEARSRIRLPKLFKVAVTRSASLLAY